MVGVNFREDSMEVAFELWTERIEVIDNYQTKQTPTEIPTVIKGSDIGIAVFIPVL